MNGILREIGRVRATTAYCKAAVDHAERAAEGLIDGNSAVATLIRTLQTADFDSSLLAKNSSVQKLAEQNAKLAEAAERGGKSARMLREDAKTADDPAAAKQLVAFADALDGALHRESTLARDTASLITYLTGRQPAVDLYAHYMGNTEFLRTSGPSGSGASASPFVTNVARDASDELVDRRNGIVADEASAENRFEAAFASCE